MVWDEFSGTFAWEEMGDGARHLFGFAFGLTFLWGLELRVEQGRDPQEGFAGFLGCYIMSEENSRTYQSDAGSGPLQEPHFCLLTSRAPPPRPPRLNPDGTVFQSRS